MLLSVAPHPTSIFTVCFAAVYSGDTSRPSPLAFYLPEVVHQARLLEAHARSLWEARANGRAHTGTVVETFLSQDSCSHTKKTKCGFLLFLSMWRAESLHSTMYVGLQFTCTRVYTKKSNVPDLAAVSLHLPYLLFLIQWVARWVRATDWCVNRLCEIASIWRLGDAKEGLLIAAGDGSRKVVDNKSLSLSGFSNALYFMLKYCFPATSTSCVWTQVSVLLNQTGSSPSRLRTFIHHFFILNHCERWHHQDRYTDRTIRKRRTRLLDQENRRRLTASHSSSAAIRS